MSPFVVRTTTTAVHAGFARQGRRRAAVAALPFIALGFAMLDSAVIYAASLMARAGQAFWAAGAF